MSDENEIEASRAPLMTHLVELRTRLIICVAAIAIAFIGCFVFSQDVYIFLTFAPSRWPRRWPNRRSSPARSI